MVKIYVTFYISITKRRVGKLLGSLLILPVYLSISKAEGEELKSLLRKVKVDSEKVALKLNIQKTMVMASSPITSWQIDGETMETVTYFIFWDSKIIADGHHSHEIKRCLFLGRKAITNLIAY